MADDKLAAFGNEYELMAAQYDTPQADTALASMMPPVVPPPTGGAGGAPGQYIQPSPGGAGAGGAPGQSIDTDWMSEQQRQPIPEMMTPQVKQAASRGWEAKGWKAPKRSPAPGGTGRVYQAPDDSGLRSPPEAPHGATVVDASGKEIGIADGKGGILDEEAALRAVGNIRGTIYDKSRGRGPSSPKWLENIGGSMEMPGMHNMDLADERMNELEIKRLQVGLSPEEASEDAEIRRFLREDPNALAWQQQRLQHQGEVVQARQQAQQRRIEAQEMEQYAEQAESMRQYERDEYTRANIRMSEAREAEQDIRRKISEADDEVKKHRFKADRRDIGRFLFDNVAIVLGALANGPQGVQAAMQQIESRLDRDMEVQRAELDAKRGRGKQLRSDLAVFQKVFQDKEQAHDALRAHRYREQAQALRTVAMQSQTARARTSLDGLAASLEQRAAEVEGGLRLSSAQLRAQQKAALLRGGGVVSRKGATADSPFIRGYIDDSKARLYSEEAGGFFPSDAARNSYVEKTSKIDSAVSALDELDALAANPATKWTPELRGKAQAALRQAMTTVTVANEQGAMSEGDAAHVKGQLGDPTQYTELGMVTNKAAAIKETRALLLRARGNYKDLVGVERGKRYSYTDDKGSIRYEAVLENPAYGEARQQQREAADIRAAGASLDE